MQRDGLRPATEVNHYLYSRSGEKTACHTTILPRQLPMVTVVSRVQRDVKDFQPETASQVTQMKQSEGKHRSS